MDGRRLRSRSCWTTSDASCVASRCGTSSTPPPVSGSGRVVGVTERVIEVSDLRKSYGDVEAVRGISFHVERGEVFAMLGPNGAGKTTTTEILEGYRTRSGGGVEVLGHDP